MAKTDLLVQGLPEEIPREHDSARNDEHRSHREPDRSPEQRSRAIWSQRFVYINSEMRKENNKTLADLRFQTEPKFLWTGAFLPMVDSTVESRFADDRTYTWQGKKVDEQTHLGFDLAKLAHSPIPASNDGKVMWAETSAFTGTAS